MKIRQKKPRKLELIKAGHIHKPIVLPKSLRCDPFVDPPPISDKELSRGVYNLMYGGVIPRDVDISVAFKRGVELLSSKQMR